ncbi:hypothetical protein GCM10027034_03030 [Ramlibacter solisilvae]
MKGQMANPEPDPAGVLRKYLLDHWMKCPAPLARRIEELDQIHSGIARPGVRRVKAHEVKR